MTTQKTIFLVALLAVCILTSCKSHINVYDGFESQGLKNIWSTDRMVNDAFKTETDIVRNGKYAAMITLRPGDMFESGEGQSNDSERDELREANRLISVEDKVYEYKFSLFLPDTFPVVPVRLVIAQWKQYCGGNKICSDDSPVMAIRYVSGRLYITMRTDTLNTTVFQTTEEVRNRWLDFKFKVRFSRSENGFVEAWLNEKQIINAKGVNCYSSRRGYGDKSCFYFKMGLYRDLMKVPMSIYIDEYSKKELTE
jgi:hypothetical protein